jgi:hypothetical protein
MEAASMARVGETAGREHSGHYLAAVASVAVVVAAMAWFAQNRTLAAAAAALGLYALHLFSIRFLLENQKVLQRFIGTPDDPRTAEQEVEDLVPAMPIDRESPERVSESVVSDPVVPPVESLEGPADPLDESEARRDYALVIEDQDELSLEGSGDSEVAPPRDWMEPLDPEADRDGIRTKGTEVPVPRHFALGTVALVRNLLTPAEVARVLLEQRMQPGKKFGVLAVEMGLLSESQREELLLAQQEGLFTDGEMREARQRLREFRENAAHSMAGLD